MSIETSQCPQCKTVFRVTPEQLETAGGWVRCGRCGAAFDATRKYTRPPPVLEEPTEEAAAPNAQWPPPRPPGPGLRPASEPPPRDSETMLSRAQHALRVAMEDDFSGPPRRHRAAGPAAWIGSFILLIALGAQAVWFHRDRLLRDPDLGPRIALWCRQLGCDPGLVHAPEQLELEDRDVQPHPEAPDALRVIAMLHNAAPFAQPCPDLRLEFLDAQGTITAARRFTPSEYMPSPPSPCVLPPEGRIGIRIDLADPGVSTLAYRFEFL